MGRELLLIVALLFVSTGAKPFSKYGRSCKDINCLSNERCVMAEDPCSAYESTQCGRYPTCKKADYAGNSCATMLCPSGQYCRTENGKPTCVNTVPNLAPAARRPTTTTRPRTPPTPPPRSSSFGGTRNSGHSGSRNTIGSGSIWNRLFGDDRSRGSSGGRRVTTTVRPTSRLRDRNGYYDTHVSYDSRGNRQWTFSG